MSSRKAKAKPAGKALAIYAYGFEKLGFTPPVGGLLSVGDIRVEFLSYKDERRLDGGEGLILPSGLFESFENESSITRVRYAVHCDSDLLLARKREAVTLAQGGGWVCCLVRRIHDSVPQGYEHVPCIDTDLVKIMLNTFGVSREPLPGGLVAHSRYDEFRDYFSRWGVAQTVLRLDPREVDCRVLATADNCTVGAEFLSQFLFLPFHTVRNSASELTDLVAHLVKGVGSYLKKRAAELPEWADAFEFETEKRLKAEYAVVLERLANLQKEIAGWRQYKALLARSGDALRDTVSLTLKTFFSLKLGEHDIGKEDLSILDEAGSPIVVLEVKGTKGGVKREYVNQVDSHRERRQLPERIPGVLIINDFMEITDFKARAAKPVAQEHIRHAVGMNTLIVRVTDLLKLMRLLEAQVDRNAAFLDLCRKGGGLLHVPEDGQPEVRTA